ncbi:NAD(P)-dependent oxidoreductase [Demequina aurantiaca]|uniref:NAD(P)-dependent oxidoreductase n=1 Tax=Demequina aurantiaca TaxID=676200 RepID=UPI003D32C439
MQFIATQHREDPVKITIIGGSKGTGARVATLALEAGHEVTVLSRSGGAPDGARAIAGDATHPAVVVEAVTGADAVVVTVGGAKAAAHQRTAVTKTVIEAMEAAGVSRLVIQSSLGAGDSDSQLSALARPVVKLLLAKALADHNEQESAVMSSRLDWTILRPTSLTDKESTGTWTALRVGEEGKLQGAVTRGDLAACILGALSDDSTIGAAFGVSH